MKETWKRLAALALTLAMIRRLHQSLGIPAHVLIAEPVTG